MFKRLIFLTSFLLVLALVSTNVALGDFIEIPVAVDSDDAEEDVGGSASFAIDLTSTDLEFMYDNDVSDPLDLQVVGIRFVDVQIPKGENIISASIRFDADDVDDPEHVGEAYVIIEGELSPNPGTFEDTLNNITARPRTTAQVAWGPEHWSEAHAKYFTPDITGIIQEIVNQDGWAAGNALVLICSQDTANASTGVLEAESFTDNETDNIDRRPTLIIEYGEALVVDEVWREAEDADVLGASWRVPVDPAASGAKYIGSENGDGNDNDTAPGDEWVAVYNFDAAAGDYKILFRGMENDSDSFWVRIPSATSQNVEDPDQPGTGWVRFNGMDAPNGWAWDEVHSDDHDREIAIWTLEAGAHTLEIAKREDGTYLDGFIITNNLFLDQATLPDKINPPPIALVPSPDDGAIEVDAVTLEWLPADVAVSHKVYLSEDETIDEAELVGETQVALIAVTLTPGATYYWRVDEVEADGTVNEGLVWSFATLALEAHFPSPEDGATEVALDAKLSWTAGKGAVLHNVYFGTDEAAVAALDMSTSKGMMMETSFDPGPMEPFMTYYWKIDEFAGFTTNPGPVWSFDTTKYIVISDDEVTLDYDNSVEPYLSEVALDTPADLTKGELADLTLRFHGGPASGVSLDEATGTYTITGAGADIWGTSDQFLVREGNTFTVSMSADGVDWAQQGTDPATIEMTDPVLIGLAVTSHQAGELRTFVFDNVDIVGNISADDASTDIGGATSGNTPAPIYVALEDSSGAVAAVTHMDPAATMINTWRDWRIPLSEFAGVDPTAAAKLYIGVGDVANPTPGGSGSIRVDDIRVVPVGPMAAFAFGSRLLDCPTFNEPSVNYTMVHHESTEAVQYDPDRGYGYEVIYPVDSPFGDRSGYGKFGPFDDSPNNRNNFADECPEELYDSFIGAKSFTNDCNAATIGDFDTPCATPEGIIFRVDVPNGLYRFVGAFGEADNVHAHRMLAEDGGSGPPENIGPNHVVLVSNHDQAQQTIGEADAAQLGAGVFARVGFDGKIPPPGDGVSPSPQFVDMDENGMPTVAGPSSPILEVTQGYIRIHQLQGNSNDGPGGSRDANGGDIVILELWKVEPIENLLANGGFEDGVPEPWSTYGDVTMEVVQELTDAVVPEAPIEGGSCLHVVVSAAGANFWDAGLQHAGHVFEAGKKYTLSAFLKCKEGTLDINFKPELGADPWSGYGDQVFTMTDEWAEYSVTTPVFAEDASPGSTSHST